MPIKGIAKVGHRHRPRKEVRDLAKKADKSVYLALVGIAVDAIVNHQYDVILSFTYFCKFPSDWPTGIRIERTTTHDTYRIKARRLLNWLYKHGHSEYDAKMLCLSTYGLERKLAAMDRMIDNIDKQAYDLNFEGEE